MKKVILTLLLSGFGMYAMGQAGMIPANQMTPMKVDYKRSVPQGKTNTGGDGISAWYDILDETATNGNETYSTGFAHIFSDSTVQVLYVQSAGAQPTLGYCTLQDVGEVFDPKFLGYNNPLSLFNTYSVDSVALAYLYHYVPEKDTIAPLSQNPDGLVHDTLIFQFYTLKTGGVDTGAFAAPATETYATCKYNWPTNLGTGTTGRTFKYILGAKDSVTVIPTGGSTPFIIAPVLNTNGTVGIPVNDVTNKKLGYNRDLFAYTVSYRPGFKWKLGDTIDEQYTTTPVKHPHSHFRIFQGENTAKDMPANVYEMSLKISSVANETVNGVPTVYHGGQRYGVDKGWPGVYVAGTAWNNFDEVLYSQFYLNSSNSSAINYNVGDPKGYILGNVYPNPASGTARLDFALGNTEQVKITMYDMLGHEIATLANGQFIAGTHTISFNTDNLKEGVYLYSINAGSFSKTLKFTVAHN